LVECGFENRGEYIKNDNVLKDLKGVLQFEVANYFSSYLI
jgi:hypothetical protein